MEDEEIKQWLNNIGIEPEKAVSSLSALQLFKLIRAATVTLFPGY